MKTEYYYCNEYGISWHNFIENYGSLYFDDMFSKFKPKRNLDDISRNPNGKVYAWINMKTFNGIWFYLNNKIIVLLEMI